MHFINLNSTTQGHFLATTVDTNPQLSEMTFVFDVTCKLSSYPGRREHFYIFSRVCFRSWSTLCHGLGFLMKNPPKYKALESVT